MLYVTCYISYSYYIERSMYSYLQIIPIGMHVNMYLLNVYIYIYIKINRIYYEIQRRHPSITITLRQHKS